MRTRATAWPALGLLLVACSFDAQGLGSLPTGSAGAGAGTTETVATGDADTGDVVTGDVVTGDANPGDANPGDADTSHADTTSSPPDDASTTEDPSNGTGPPPSCGGRLWWDVDFSQDPTTLDVNADGTRDWTLRDAASFPVAELTGGVWASSPDRVLDTRPLDDFRGRTIAWVRMRSTQEPDAGRGAVLWLNVGYDRDRFAPIFASLVLQPSGTQRLVVVNLSEAPPLLDLPDLGTGMVEVALDIDVDAATVAVHVDGVDHGSFPLTFRDREGNDDRWATLVAWGAEAEFDAARVEQCP